MKIAVLKAGEATDLKSVDKVVHILKEYGIKADKISPEDIAKGKLSKFDVLVIPGGRALKQAEALGDEGRKIVKEFVEKGGGYIGICAGAYLASKGEGKFASYLGIVNTQAADIEHWDRGCGDVQVKVKDPNHPVLKAYYGVLTVYYENGPILRRSNDLNLVPYTELATYISDIHENGPEKITPNASALTASEYGNGRVVLFSFHPEFTAGLEEMLVQAALWCAKTSPEEYPLKLKKTHDVKIKGAWLWGKTVYNLGVDGAKIITDQMKEYGFTDIFLLVKGTAGRVDYNSKIALGLAHPDRDILKEVVEEAHKKGIRVHAWFVVGSDKQWATLHPEDRMVHIKRGPDDTAVALLSLNYREYVKNIVKEVLGNYKIEGIHVDYIRYLHVEFGFNEDYEIAEAKKMGLNIDKVKYLIDRTYYTEKDGKSIFEAYDKGDKDVIGWVGIRRNAVKSFAEEIKNVVKSYNPKVKYSAALKPEGAYTSNFLIAQNDSKTFVIVHCGQDYKDAFLIYDFVTPMLYWAYYGKSPQWTVVLYNNAKNILGKERVYPGLQAYSPVKTSDLSDAINYIKRDEGEGIVFFKYDTFALSKIDIKKINNKEEKIINIILTNSLSRDNFSDVNVTEEEIENVDITKVEIEMKGNYTIKNILESTPEVTIQVSENNKLITITGNPCIPQNGTLKISAVIEGEGDKNCEPAQVRFYVTDKYYEVRVYNQY
ncbi:MAG TPA: family 10 glycosylhydrolase [Clostridia bacterium]|nr:family 10 glycosylhydrolase [Clostridia bacterium]